MIPIRLKRALLTGLVLLGFSGAGWAIPLANPFPAFLNDDIDGIGLFQPGSPALSIEYLDFFDNPNVPTIFDPAPGSEFGFYYGNGANPPTELIRVFGAEDMTPVPITNNQQALIDFDLGVVLDLDDGVVENLFTPVANAAIGFYLSIPETTVNPELTLFSQAVLNGGADVAGAFPFISDPETFAIIFGAPGTKALSIHAFTPLTAVPVPGAAGLWLLGLAGLALFRRKLSRA